MNAVQVFEGDGVDRSRGWLIYDTKPDVDLHWFGMPGGRLLGWKADPKQLVPFPTQEAASRALKWWTECWLKPVDVSRFRFRVVPA